MGTPWAGAHARLQWNEGTADLGPDLEGSHPRFSILNGGDVLVAKVKQVVDRVA